MQPPTPIDCPAGMVEVTKDEFYAFIGPMNVIGNLSDPYLTIWETPSRTVVGASWPGWKQSGISFMPGWENRYFVKR